MRITINPFRSIFVLPVFFLSILTIAPPAGAQPDAEFVRLRVEPPYISPDDDGTKDQAFFSPVLQSAGDASRWRLTIRKDGGGKIRRLSGADFTALIRWDGRDKKERVVPDGRYTGELQVKGSGFNLTSERVPVFVDTEPPQVVLATLNDSLDPTVPGREMITFRPTLRDSAPIALWQIQILDLTGRTVKVHWSSGPATDVVWDGTDVATRALVPKGVYRCALQAWDAAGNESAPSFVDVNVTVTARDMLEQVLRRVTPVMTDLGLVLQLPADDLFGYRNGRPFLKPSADEILREVALIVNAYPDVSVRLDGYSTLRRNAAQDRERGSRYAWNIYSHLVKQGNVKASRLNVKGRGRVASPERNGVGLPLVKNGVEVLLEGNRDW